jgi:hypothetical protein
MLNKNLILYTLDGTKILKLYGPIEDSKPYLEMVKFIHPEVRVI